ncbi:MAG: Zn finger domain-containing DnaJ-class molecular chaperone [bacterium]|nr:MAG: Zn finger domain-containing DnaJ-class molecular chaperone [bacterium]
MRGELSQDCLPDVLRQLYLERRSGCLRLTQDHTRKEVFFELGAMIFASSNRREDRIGESMLRHSTITQEQFDQTQAQMGRGKRFGKILVDLKIISERDLIANVTFQILDIIYSIFNWTTGHYEFYEVDKTISEDLKLELSTASIILEGVRRTSDMDVIERGLGDLNRLVGPCTNPLLRLQTLSLRPLERQIIEVIKEPMSLIKLLVKIKSPSETVLRSLYGLLSAGVLERFAPAELSQESGKMEVPEKVVRQTLGLGEAVPVVLARPTGAHKVDEMALRRRIDLVKARMKDGDIYQLFSLSTNSQLEDLQNSYYKLAREFHPDRHLTASKEIRAEIDEVFTHLTSLYDHGRSILVCETTAMPIPTGVTGSIARNTAPHPIEGMPLTPPMPKRGVSNRVANIPPSSTVVSAIETIVISETTEALPSFEETLSEGLITNTIEDIALEEINVPQIVSQMSSELKTPKTGYNLAVLPLENKLKQTVLDAPAFTQSLEVMDSTTSTKGLVNTSETEALIDALDEMSVLSMPLLSESDTSYRGATEPLLMSENEQFVAPTSIIADQENYLPISKTETMSEYAHMVSEADSATDLGDLFTEEIIDSLEEIEEIEGIEENGTTPLLINSPTVIDEQEQAERLFVDGRNYFQCKKQLGSLLGKHVIVYC